MAARDHRVHRFLPRDGERLLDPALLAHGAGGEADQAAAEPQRVGAEQDVLRDESAPLPALRATCRQWNPQAALEIVPGAGHVYGGFRRTLEETIAVHI